MRSLRPMFGVFVTLMLALWAPASDKHPAPLQSSNLHFLVLKDDNNKPVRNASVVLHPVVKGGKQSNGGFQLKTDNEGKTETEGIPYGPLRIQVLAPGFQTYGDDYQVDKPDMEIEIRLKRPTDQMSIYGNEKKGQTATPMTAPTDPKP